MSSFETPDLTRRRFLQLSGAGVASLATLGLSGCLSTAANHGGSGPAKSTLGAAFSRPILELDPHGASDVDQGTLLAARQIYDTLVVRQGDTYTKSLATGWTQPDPTSWVITLRKDVTFHDGAGLTARDVKASLERLAKSKTPMAPLWAALSAVDAVDDHTIKITTTAPIGTMLANLSLLSIVPAARLAEPDFFKKPVGTGPFQVDSYTPSDHLNLKANPKYWDGPPKTAAVKLPFMPETSSRITAIKNGEVDATWLVPPDQIADLRGDAGVNLQVVPSYTNYFCWFNASRKPFSDANVRRALWHALDLQQTIKSLFGASGEVAKAPISPRVFGYAPQQPYAHDPEKAKQLLAAAGYPDGFSATIIWGQGQGPLIDQLAQAMVSDWSKIGVKIQATQLENAQWLQKLLALDWDLELQTNGVTTGDADFVLGRLYLSTARRTGYANPDLDKILLEARAATDQGARKQLYAQACKIVWDDAVGIFPCDLKNVYAVSRKVSGWVATPDQIPPLRGVTVSSGA